MRLADAGKARSRLPVFLLVSKGGSVSLPLAVVAHGLARVAVPQRLAHILADEPWLAVLIHHCPNLVPLELEQRQGLPRQVFDR